MISRRLTQFGIDVGSVMRPGPVLVGDVSGKTYNTFYVPEAVGSSYIPTPDDFVIPNGIKSVFGRTVRGKHVLEGQHSRRCQRSRGALCRQQGFRLQSG